MADTSTIRATQSSRAKGASSPASAPSPVPQPQQQQQPHHIRWSNDIPTETPEDPDFVVANPAYREPGDNSIAKPTSSSAVKKNKTERGGGEEGEDYSLDKLLDGLTELSQTLPGKEVTNEPTLLQLTILVKWRRYSLAAVIPTFRGA